MHYVNCDPQVAALARASGLSDVWRSPLNLRGRLTTTRGMTPSLPRHLPTLSQLLDNLARPHEDVARYLGISASTLRRWRAKDRAPRPALLALFWVSTWGQSALDADLANYATLHAGLAKTREAALHNLRSKITRLLRLASFGAANDPVVDIDGWAFDGTRPPTVQDDGRRPWPSWVRR